jgi:hypothetical protein
MRVILALALVLGVTVGGFSFDVHSFPDPIGKGDFLISGGFGLGKLYPNYWHSSALLGGSLAVEYALPINFALTVGGELGFSGSNLKGYSGYDSDISLLEIPVIARVAWHPNWEVKNLDTYVLAKIGYGFGVWAGDDNWDNPNGFIFGTNIGVRYFFTQALGVFAEGGYEYHHLDSDGFAPSAFGVKFITLGLTLKP